MSPSAPSTTQMKAAAPSAAPQQNAISPALLNQAIDFTALVEFASFANSLDLARCFWRRYRALVEAPEFPTFLLATLRKSGDNLVPDQLRSVEPTIDVPACIEANAITPQVRAQLMPEGVRAARVWLENGIAAKKGIN